MYSQCLSFHAMLFMNSIGVDIDSCRQQMYQTSMIALRWRCSGNRFVGLLYQMSMMKVAMFQATSSLSCCFQVRCPARQ